MLYQVREKRLKLADTELPYITFGTGSRPLVLIQGLNTRGIEGAGAGLAWMYRMFARDYRVYLFDRRPDVWEGITVRELARDIADAMEALHLTNADILGVSQGGMIAQYLAMDRPELVHAMILAATLSQTNETVSTVIENWCALARQGDMKALVADMAAKLYSDKYLKKYTPLLPLLTLLQKPKDVRRFCILAQSCLTCSTYEELDRIRCPVLVIGGKKDRIVGSAAPAELAEGLGCGLILYDELGHAVYEEAKDFNQNVYDFFKANRG